jgi:hypothetical protein
MSSPVVFLLRNPVLTRWAIRRAAFTLLSAAQIMLRPVPANAQVACPTDHPAPAAVFVAAP